MGADRDGVGGDLIDVGGHARSVAIQGPPSDLRPRRFLVSGYLRHLSSQVCRRPVRRLSRAGSNLPDIVTRHRRYVQQTVYLLT
jgi:hypothetical protein